jgi:hypothetical protein
MSPAELRREQRAARRRTVAVLVRRRLEAAALRADRQVTLVPFANASISSTERIPTDS